ncbi:YhdH/YhfP family quinone oxidoreductase [Rufibacter psychrotolerans]|uniref:YhdH/YhfP family quinone oxidoreductase n=1 Tax=Rufibacter psychrotolerans TaxID=2812556 RepID=UPI001966E268|nr:YhdH/YhfP family quinone oxidoreductase [Rufibacter sp. SYSU D00308]
MEKEFQCLLVTQTDTGEFHQEVTQKRVQDLPPGEVLIRVQYSSLNYKDALSATGNRGVTRQFPHTPGIDAAGVVESSTSPDWQPGDEVIVTGFDLGMNTSGGFAQYIRVPANWVVRLPAGMSLRESMVYGTAGFTAALSVEALLRNGVTPQKGPIAVTGATGGVGSIAVALLHQLGYTVHAVSSKASAQDFLHQLGATEIILRADLEDQSGKALLKPRFAGAVDTVGGQVLATLLKSVHYGGTVTCCGMVNGAEVPTTVFPFILRGIQLAGIDSVEYPAERRPAVWQQMAQGWKPRTLETLAHEITLQELPQAIATILKGQMQGRALVRLP